jgi:hypothetical protein
VGQPALLEEGASVVVDRGRAERLLDAAKDRLSRSVPAGCGEERRDCLSFIVGGLANRVRRPAAQELGLSFAEALAGGEQCTHVHPLAPGELIHDRGPGRRLAEILDSHGGRALALAAEALRESLPLTDEVARSGAVEAVDFLLEVQRFTTWMARSGS